MLKCYLHFVEATGKKIEGIVKSQVCERHPQSLFSHQLLATIAKKIESKLSLHCGFTVGDNQSSVLYCCY